MARTFEPVLMLECTGVGTCRVETPDGEQLTPINEVHIEEPKIITDFDATLGFADPTKNFFSFSFEPGVASCTRLEDDDGHAELFCSFATGEQGD